MMKFSRLSGVLFKGRLGKNPLGRSYETLSGLFSSDDREEQWRRTVLALIHTMLSENGMVSSERIEVFRRLVESKKGAEEAFRQIRLLKEVADISPAEAAASLAGLDLEEREKLLNFLVLLALMTNAFDEKNHKLLFEFALASGMDGEAFARIIASARTEKNVRERLIRSGAGLLAAIGIIALFILTATLLRSVIFGLIGAYLLLPLEKYFERKLRSRRGFIFTCVRLTGYLFLPLHLLSQAVKRRMPVENNSPADQQKKQENKITKQAVTLTVLLISIFAVSAVVFISSAAGKYVGQLRESVKSIRQYARTGEASGLPAGGSEAVDWVEKMKSRLKSSPAVKQLVTFIRENLDDDKTRREIAGMLLRSTGGMVNFTTSLVGTLAALAGDVVLSLFFGLLFMFKLAEFCRNDSSSGRQSEYLIRTVFNGKWLPGANENTIAEARNILSGTFMRLRIWVRGYLLLMLIDATVYTTAFFFLNIPYFPLLGVVAGCGILLPYVGPIAGCLLTVTVTLAMGSGGGMQIIALLVFYLIYSGVIEQFILYPAVIGESLGLTTLETIIVVLLGAVFAGIAGMIFALPAASVLKFIVPKIYHCWETPGGKREEMP